MYLKKINPFLLVIHLCAIHSSLVVISIFIVYTSNALEECENVIEGHGDIILRGEIEEKFNPM